MLKEMLEQEPVMSKEMLELTQCSVLEQVELTINMRDVLRAI